MITKEPSLTESFSSASVTLGEYNLIKYNGFASAPISDNVALSFSVVNTKRDGFSTNLHNGQDLDDDDSYSIRNDMYIQLDASSSLRLFGQYANIDSNGSAMKGIDDTTVGARNLKPVSYTHLTLPTIRSV